MEMRAPPPPDRNTTPRTSLARTTNRKKEIYKNIIHIARAAGYP